MGRFATVAAMVLACAVGVQAEVTIDTVTIGNPGNDGEWSGESYGGCGPDRICGAVDYVYNIGTFEVTAGQYTEFLNAVASYDPAHPNDGSYADQYGLYSEWMDLNLYPDDRGCNIQRAGSGTESDPYEYAVAVDWADRPVNYVCWYDALRFANWMHNGQGNGETEDGAYDMSDGSSVVRKEDGALVFLPSEDEWYKAAYHKNDGVTNNYFDYPACGDSVPVSEPCPGGTNSANYRGDGYALGPPFYRNECGCYVSSGTCYGTFDQCGNVWEWNEEDMFGDGSYRGCRGGSFYQTVNYCHALSRCSLPSGPWDQSSDIGFRVAQVPEQGPVPAVSEWGVAVMTLLTLMAGAVVLTRRRAAVV